MSTPIVVDVPHRLTRDEVRRRLGGRVGELPAHIPGGIATVRSEWPGEDRMAIDVTAMGQTIAATLDIQDTAVRVSFTLPPLLSFMSGPISAAIKSRGAQLLLGSA